MATARMLSSSNRVVAYMPNLRAAVRHFRAFSSCDERKPPADRIIVRVDADSFERPVHCQLGILAPADRRFPLPGMQGPVSVVTEAGGIQEQALHIPLPDIFSAPLPSDRHISALGQYMAASRNNPDEWVGEEDLELSTALDHLECVAQECPKLLKKELADLFPGRDLSFGDVTVITISQKTENDMTGWSSEVEVERETLLEQFVQGAQDMCSALKAAGYWADFIDPSSGTPFYGAHTNSSFFETDERYRQLGFELEDLGCCRVIKHHLWGTKAYVGSLFTDAPFNHPVITDMIDKTEY